MPLLARYGPALRDEMLAGARDHARQLLGDEDRQLCSRKPKRAGPHVIGDDEPKDRLNQPAQGEESEEKIERSRSFQHHKRTK